MGDLRRNPLAQMRMEQPFGDQRCHRCALPERARKTDVGPLEERGLSGLVEREEPPHLGMEMRVGEGVGGELVAKEASDDVLGVGDGVQGHSLRLTPNRQRLRAVCPSPTDSCVS